jgi:hypothetical protein
MTINEFAIQFFGNKTIQNSTLNSWFNDYKASGLNFEVWRALLTTKS